jgi:putative hemolysin
LSETEVSLPARQTEFRLSWERTPKPMLESQYCVHCGGRHLSRLLGTLGLCRPPQGRHTNTYASLTSTAEVIGLSCVADPWRKQTLSALRRGRHRVQARGETCPLSTTVAQGQPSACSLTSSTGQKLCYRVKPTRGVIKVFVVRSLPLTLATGHHPLALEFTFISRELRAVAALKASTYGGVKFCSFEVVRSP